MSERLLGAIVLAIAWLVETFDDARRRLRCARRGHQWRPVLGAYLCSCGRWKD